MGLTMSRAASILASVVSMVFVSSVPASSASQDFDTSRQGSAQREFATILNQGVALRDEDRTSGAVRDDLLTFGYVGDGASPLSLDSVSFRVGAVTMTLSEIDSLLPEPGQGLEEPSEGIEPPADGDTASPYLLDPADSIACNVLGAEYHEIASLYAMPYTGPGNPFSGGDVGLTCGNAYFGYIHIRDGHQADWESKYVSLGFSPGSSLWDDFMYFVVLNTAGYPETMLAKANGTVCYTAPVIMMLDDMPTERFYPTVSISRDNRVVVTAYPGGKCGLW